MTHCEVCHSRIYTYKTFKIGVKTVCYHCKIKDLEAKLEAIETLTLDHHKDEQLVHPIKLLKILERKG